MAVTHAPVNLTSALPELPPEILRIVSSFCDHQRLSSLSRVNTVLNHHAEYHIWRTIDLRGMGATCGLLVGLRRRKHLVKTLKCRVDQFQCPCTPDVLQETQRSLVNLEIHPSEVKVGEPRQAPLLSIDSFHFPGLRSLTVSLDTRVLDMVASVFAGCPQITSLTILPPATPEQVPLDQKLNPVFSHLLHLDVPILLEEYVPIVLHIIRNSKSLESVRVLPAYGFRRKPWVSELDEALRTLPNLRYRLSLLASPRSRKSTTSPSVSSPRSPTSTVTYQCNA